MMVSCKNAKTAEPTPEEIQAQKQALADSVLAEIDAFAERYFDASSHCFKVGGLELSEKEKNVKPDYLLDPSIVNTFITRSQKINALAIYYVERALRKAYDMPQEEVKDAIAKLALELNYPIDVDFWMSDAPTSEKVKREYNAFKERNELSFFWQFQNAIIRECDYIIAQNPELFFSKITEDQWLAFNTNRNTEVNAIDELAKYDEEMALFCEFRNKSRITVPKEEIHQKNASLESARQYYVTYKDVYIAGRNALLQ